MTHRRKLGSFSFHTAWGTPAFLFLAAVFLCGTAAGSLTGLRSAAVEGALVSELTDAVLTAGKTTLSNGLLFTSLFPAFLWPIAALLCGACRPHSLLLSALVAARGFLFAFAIASMLGALGLDGIVLSIVSCAAGSILTLPCLLLVATIAFQAALDRPARPGGYWYSLARYRGALLICFLISMFGGGIRIAAMLLAQHNWFP